MMAEIALRNHFTNQNQLGRALVNNMLVVKKEKKWLYRFNLVQ